MADLGQVATADPFDGLLKFLSLFLGEAGWNVTIDIGLVLVIFAVQLVFYFIATPGRLCCRA